jgi:3-hydroxyacyl-[acyl-carrier-protein] dehydratase
MEESVARKIIRRLPYGKEFTFVDELLEISENGATGFYTYPKNRFENTGHFASVPIVPGIILLETMGQIGGVCLGIYLLKLFENENEFYPLVSSFQADFFKSVDPGEKIKVITKKVYFRNNILKCTSEMFNINEELVANSTAICKFIFNKP